MKLRTALAFFITNCSKLNVFRFQPYAYKNELSQVPVTSCFRRKVLGSSTPSSLALAFLFPVLSLLTICSEDLITNFLIRLTVLSVSVLAKCRKYTHNWCLLIRSLCTVQQYCSMNINLDLNLDLEC